jgi:hypothetical protein
VSAIGAEKAFAVAACGHQFKFLIFDTVGTTDGVGALGSNAFCSAHEGITFLVNWKAVLARDRGFTGEGLRTNGTGREVGIKRHKVMTQLRLQPPFY